MGSHSIDNCIGDKIVLSGVDSEHFETIIDTVQLHSKQEGLEGIGRVPYKVQQSNINNEQLLNVMPGSPSLINIAKDEKLDSVIHRRA